jgi:hypothetical protein
VTGTKGLGHVSKLVVSLQSSAAGVPDGQTKGALTCETCGPSTHRVGMNTWPQTHEANVESVMVTHHQYILTGSQPPTMSGCTISGVSDGEAKGALGVE